MDRITLTCDEIDVDYENLVALRNDGKLELGIGQQMAAEIVKNNNLKPKKMYVQAAFYSWSYIAFAFIIFLLYLGFSNSWWWIIVGIISAFIAASSIMEINTRNVIEAAFAEKEFYEKVRSLGAWLYKIEESEADKFRENSS